MAEAPHKYLPLFISEAGEQLEQLQSELVKLEQEPPGGPLWASIFRRVHSVKGSAATVGLPPIVDIAHAAEPLIGKLNAFFSLTKACQAPGARALIVQRKLRALGTLMEMEPAPQSLMQKKGGVRVAALLATSRPLDEVRGAFEGIPEVESVEVRVAP